MRTILLKRRYSIFSNLRPALTSSDGGSLIYTTPFLASSLQSLIHSTLGIHSLLKRQSLRHNVIDRDKILVPANWDSWGKIRIIREGFDIEGVGNAWSIEIQDPLGTEDQKPEADDGSSAVAIYEQTIKDPRAATSTVPNGTSGTKPTAPRIEIETEDMQTFLAKQQEILEKLKAEDEKDRAARKVPKQLEMSPNLDEGLVNDHIGPVQFNMGGIQVDADDMLRKLKVNPPPSLSLGGGIRAC